MEGWRGSIIIKFTRDINISSYSLEISHRPSLFSPRQWAAVNIFVCLDLKISWAVIHSLHGQTFVTNPENPLWPLDLGWMGAECYNIRNIHNKYENWPPSIKTVHSPTPRITDFQQWCKNSTLWILYRWIIVETFPSDEMETVQNTIFSKIAAWMMIIVRTRIYFVLEDGGGS